MSLLEYYTIEVISDINNALSNIWFCTRKGDVFMRISGFQNRNNFDVLFEKELLAHKMDLVEFQDALSQGMSHLKKYFNTVTFDDIDEEVQNQWDNSKECKDRTERRISTWQLAYSSHAQIEVLVPNQQGKTIFSVVKTQEQNPLVTFHSSITEIVIEFRDMKKLLNEIVKSFNQS